MRRLFRRKGDQHIGTILVNLGFITSSQLLRALDAKIDRDVLLGEVLVAQNACTPAQLERALTIQKALRGDGPDYTAKAKKLVSEAGRAIDLLQGSLTEVEITARRLTEREDAKE